MFMKVTTRWKPGLKRSLKGHATRSHAVAKPARHLVMQMQIFLCFWPYKEWISKEINNDNDLNLHSMTKLSGWLRYWSHVLLLRNWRSTFGNIPKKYGLLEARSRNLASGKPRTYTDEGVFRHVKQLGKIHVCVDSSHWYFSRLVF